MHSFQKTTFPNIRTQSPAQPSTSQPNPFFNQQRFPQQIQHFQPPLRYPTQQPFPPYTFPNQNRFQQPKPSEHPKNCTNKNNGKQKTKNNTNTNQGWEPEQPELEHLEFNCQHAIRLPYIVISEINAKLLIDTGASASSMPTKKSESEFPEYILYSPFTVTTMHGITQHDYILEILSLATSNAYGQTHKFNIVDFSKKYDGTLGLKLLDEMGAGIYFKQKVLRTSLRSSLKSNYTLKIRRSTSDLENEEFFDYQSIEIYKKY
ncbi:hypothetical protein QE152_g19552 [Popillia japonica]|uniref:Uncharacterized protein n=1 Tax=Popillia japonica TaxID=7064 RepID=A0AAW1KNC8_POPJA